MLNADDVARYFLVCQDTEHHEPITNLKLQKLCYYAQGIALVVQGSPLFHDDIEHWQHGPVVPEIDKKYKSHGSAPIAPPENLDLRSYDSTTRTLLDRVYRDYGKYSASQLRNKTHEESPWKDTPHGGAITFPQLRDHFESLSEIYEYFPTIDRETLRRMPENPLVMKDLKRGIDAMKSRQMIAWSQVKEELGIP